MTPVRLEPAAPQSRAKHSTTEPLRSLCLLVWLCSGTSNTTQILKCIPIKIPIGLDALN